MLRAGKFSESDVEHIAEEIESMGRFQAGLRGNSWRLSVKEQREPLAGHVSDNPSLKATMADSIGAGFRLARITSARETGRPEEVFPLTCAWWFEQIMAGDFWPGDM